MRPLGMVQELQKPMKFDRSYILPSLVCFGLAAVTGILFFIHEQLHPPIIGDRDLGEGLLAVFVFIGIGAFILCGILALAVAYGVFVWRKRRANSI
jgi:hypothetical protein